jgi:phage-related protein
MQLIPTIMMTIFDLAVQLVKNVNWIGLGQFVINTIVNGIRALFTLIPQILQQIGQTALNLFQSIDWLGLGSRVINFIANGIKFLITAIPNLLQTIGTNAVNLFQSIDWLGLGSKVINFIVNGIKSLISAIPDALKNIGQKAFEAFKNINWLSLGTNIITGVVNGIKGAAHKVVDIMKNLASSALDTVKSFLGIKSPSRVFRDQVGKNIGLGVVEGIEDTYQKVNLAMESLISIPDKYDFSSSLVGQDSTQESYNDRVIKSGDVYNININQPIDTPDEIARILRTEAQYGLIGGVAIG